MTISVLVEELKNFCIDATKHLKFPTALQKGDTEIIERAPEVYKMRLPNSNDAKKVAPYIIVQARNGVYKQDQGKPADASATVFLTFCVYCSDEQEGAMMLLNVMDAVRIKLLRQVVIAQQFKLDLKNDGLEFLIFPEDTAPYYGGVITLNFEMPPIEREVKLI